MNNAGRTLLEILVALAIAATASGSAGVLLRDPLERWELHAAVQQIRGDLRLARVRAIADGRARRLVFDVPGKHYRRQIRLRNRSYADEGSAVALPRTVQLTDCSARGDAIGFQPRGHASSFGSVRLTGAQGETRTLVVDMAGRVRVAR